jgi:hypothetical protein
LRCVIMCLRSEFRSESVTISAKKRCSVRLYLQLFVEGLMSSLRYLCLFPFSCVQHILCCVFLRIMYPILPVALDLPILIAPLVLSNDYETDNARNIRTSLNCRLGTNSDSFWSMSCSRPYCDCKMSSTIKRFVP